MAEELEGLALGERSGWRKRAETHLEVGGGDGGEGEAEGVGVGQERGYD